MKLNKTLQDNLNAEAKEAKTISQADIAIKAKRAEQKKRKDNLFYAFEINNINDTYITI